MAAKATTTLNSSLLKELLHGRPVGHKKNADFDPNQFAEEIIKQELGTAGSILPSRGLKKKKKKRSKHIKRAFVTTGSLEKAESTFLHGNNLHDYSEKWALHRGDLEMLERQYPFIQDYSKKTVSTVLDTIEQLVGEEKELTKEDLAIASQYLSTTDVDNSVVYEALQKKFAQDVQLPSIQSSAASRPVSSSSESKENQEDFQPDNDKINDPNEVHDETTLQDTHGTEKKTRVLHAAKSLMLVHKLMHFVGQRLGSNPDWQQSYELLQQRKRSAEQHRHTHGAGGSQYQFTSTMDPGTSFLEQLHATMSMHQTKPSSQNTMKSHHESTSSSMMYSTQNSTFQPDAESTDFSATSESNMHVQSQKLPPLHLTAPATLHKSLSASILPSKQLPAQQQQQHKTFIDTKKFGFDPSFSRPTPRVLHYGNGNNNNSHIPDIQALRQELEASQLGVQELNKRVDANIAWVQENCDMSQYAAYLSDRTKAKVKKMATERMLTVLLHWSQRRQFHALHQLKENMFLLRAKETVRRYCRVKAVHVFGRLLIRNYLKLTAHRFSHWLKFVRVRIHMEKEAAAVDIQRIMRGKLAILRVHRLNLSRQATVIQQVVRLSLAKRLVEQKKAAKEQAIAATAATVLQESLRGFVAIRRAKEEKEKRRAIKAATNIQKIIRGKLGREKVAEEVKRAQLEANLRKTEQQPVSSKPSSPAPRSARTPATTTGTDLDALAALATVSDHQPPQEADGIAPKESESARSAVSSPTKSPVTKATTTQNNNNKKKATTTSIQKNNKKSNVSPAKKRTTTTKNAATTTTAAAAAASSSSKRLEASAKVPVIEKTPSSSLPADTTASQSPLASARASPLSARSANSNSNNPSGTTHINMNASSSRPSSHPSSRPSSSRPTSRPSSRPSSSYLNSNSINNTSSTTTMTGEGSVTSTKDNEVGHALAIQYEHDEEHNNTHNHKNTDKSSRAQKKPDAPLPIIQDTADAAVQIQKIARSKLAKKKVENKKTETAVAVAAGGGASIGEKKTSTGMKKPVKKSALGNNKGSAESSPTVSHVPSIDDFEAILLNSRNSHATAEDHRNSPNNNRSAGSALYIDVPAMEEGADGGGVLSPANNDLQARNETDFRDKNGEQDEKDEEEKEEKHVSPLVISTEAEEEDDKPDKTDANEAKNDDNNKDNEDADDEHSAVPSPKPLSAAATGTRPGTGAGGVVVVDGTRSTTPSRSTSLSPFRSLSSMLGNALDSVIRSASASPSQSRHTTTGSPQENGTSSHGPSPSKTASFRGFFRNAFGSSSSAISVPSTPPKSSQSHTDHPDIAQKETEVVIDHFPLPPDAAQRVDDTEEADNDNVVETHNPNLGSNDNNNDADQEPAVVSESVPPSRPGTTTTSATAAAEAAVTQTSKSSKSSTPDKKPSSAQSMTGKKPSSSSQGKSKDKVSDKGNDKVSDKGKAKDAKPPAPTLQKKDSAHHKKPPLVTNASALKDETVDNAPQTVPILCIQQCVRRFLARRRVTHQRVAMKARQLHLARWVTYATLTIQRIVRGKLGRVRFLSIQARTLRERRETQERSARKIQAVARGFHARKYIVPGKRKVYLEKKQHREFIESFQKKDQPAPRLLSSSSPSPSSSEIEEKETKKEGTSKNIKTKKDKDTTADEKSPVPKLDFKKKKPTTSTDATSPSSHVPKSETSPLKNSNNNNSKDTDSSGVTKNTNGVLDTVAQEKLSEIDAKLQELAALEQRLKDSEALVQQQAQTAAKQLEEQLKRLEEQTKKAEAERLAQQELLHLAAGPITGRSPYATINSANLQKQQSTLLNKQQQQQQQRTGGGTSSMMSTLMRTNGPPTGRSAKAGHYPPNAPRLTYNQQEWVQLWDYDENAYYWWCEATQTAQWEQPGMDPAYYYNNYYPSQEYVSSTDPTSAATATTGTGTTGIAAMSSKEDDAVSVAYSESSTGAMTDVSMDQDSYYNNGNYHNNYYTGEGDVDYAAAAALGWHEYYDESAQAKYWYNDNTGEASWTLPESLQPQVRPATSARDTTAMNTQYNAVSTSANITTATTATSNNNSNNSGWVSYLDEETGQLYWHNVHTGEVRWDV